MSNSTKKTEKVNKFLLDVDWGTIESDYGFSDEEPAKCENSKVDDVLIQRKQYLMKAAAENYRGRGKYLLRQLEKMMTPAEFSNYCSEKEKDSRRKYLTKMAEINYRGRGNHFKRQLQKLDRPGEQSSSISQE